MYPNSISSVHPSLREFTLLTEIKVKFKCLVISQDLCSYIISPTLQPGRERNIQSYNIKEKLNAKIKNRKQNIKIYVKEKTIKKKI